MAFKIGQEDLGKSSQIKYLGEEVLENGLVGSRIELTPKSVGDYKTNELWVNPEGAVVRTKAVRALGGSTDVLFSNLVKNGPVGAREFIVMPEPGTQVIKN